MFDAYNIKKILPRLFAAVILIQLSWFLFTGVIQMVNSVAYGIESLIYEPFGGAEALELKNILSDIGGGSGLGAFSAIAAGAAAIAVAFAVGGVLATAAIALLGILIAFALLLFRQVAIVALLIISPLALVAWILPGTEKWWKMWWDSFFKLLLVYPIVLGMIAAGRALAAVVAEVDPASGTFGAIDDLITFFFVIACVFGPFYLIPKTFQMAGGVFQTLTGSLNNRSKGAFDRLRNRRKQTQAKTWENSKSGNRFKGGTETNMRGKLNRGLMKGSLAGQAGLNPIAMRRKINAAETARASELMAKGRENNAVKTVLNNDDLLDAFDKGGGTSEGMRKYYRDHLGISSDEAERNIAMIEHAQRAVGADAFGAIAAVANAGTGTGYGAGSGQMLAAANRASRGNSHLKAQIIAEQRGAAERARRGDLYGGSFSENMKVADDMQRDNNSERSIRDANLHMAKQALKGKSAHELASGRAGAIKNLIPAMQARITEASGNVAAMQAKYENGDATEQEVMEAKHEEKRVLAHTAAFLDAAGSANPEIAEDLGKQIFGMAMPGGTGLNRMTSGDMYTTDSVTGKKVQVASGVRPETVGDRIASLRADSEFGQYRREYGDARSAAAGASAAELASQTGPQQ